MANVDYEVFLRDSNNSYIAKVDSWNSLAVEEHFGDVATGSIKIPPSATCASRIPSTYAIAVKRTDAYSTRTLVSGPIAKPTYTYDEKGTEIDIQFRDFTKLLKNRVVFPSGYTGSAPGTLTFSAANDVYPSSGTGAPAESAIYHFVDANIGPSATNGRRNTLITLATDLARGLNVKVTARFKQNLLQLLQTLIYADPSLGYNLVEQADGSLLFSVYAVRDLTSSVIFSKTNGTLRNVTYDIEEPIANFILVLGSGTGTGRTPYAVSNAASITKYGLIEAIWTYNNTSDSDSMKTLANAQLNEWSDIFSAAVQVNDTAMVKFGRDYQLGDKVTLIDPITGDVRQEIIRSVQYHVTSTEGEIITPVIATPNKRHGVKKSKKGWLIIDQRLSDLESAA